MRKKIIYFGIFLCLSVPLYVSARTACGVSSNPAANTGKCRRVATGGDECFNNGQGPACAGTLTLNPIQ